MASTSRKHSAPLWASEPGPYPEFAVSTRIRLARNFDGYPFAQLLNSKQRDRIWKRLMEALGESEDFSACQFSPLAKLPRRERLMLIEEHLLSPHMERPSPGAGMIVSQAKDLAIMVNEEDHLRIQIILPGLQLEQGWERAEALDCRLEEVAAFAFHGDLGYLTACPTNLGTGMRGSVMLHLPGLILNGQMGDLIGVLYGNDVLVRGFFGEGTKVSGNIFQLSNQKTLGRSESTILEELQKVTLQVIEKERTARKVLMAENRISLENDVRRSLGIILYASTVSFEEALELLSMVRLGNEVGLLDAEIPDFNLALTTLGDAHLAKAARGDTSPEELDRRRADLLRGFVKA